MEIIIYFLPFITAAVLLYFFKEEVAWWEYLILIIPSILFTLLTKEIMISIKTSDTEYWGGYITKIRHYDEWDEWVERTCTREVPCGTDEHGNTKYRTETYDCSYRQHHPEMWVYMNNLCKYEIPVDKELFNIIKRKLQARMIFVDMHRHYYKIDGDAQDYYWDGKKEHIYTITEPHLYTNKIIASNSIFKFEKISKEEATEYGLYDYPKIINLEQKPVLNKYGFYVSKEEINDIQYINATYGSKKQFRVYLLLFREEQGIEIAQKQQSYWQGGNKNELVVCFGLKPNKIVSWCYAFSWEDTQEMAILSMEQYRNNEYLNISEYSKWLIHNLNNWRRKEFSDFKYIRITLSVTQYIILFFLVVALNIGIAYGLIINEYKNEYLD